MTIIEELLQLFRDNPAPPVPLTPNDDKAEVIPLREPDGVIHYVELIEKKK